LLFLVFQIYVDTVGDPKWYQQRLERLFGHQAKTIVVCPKADSIYKVVGAASICAKVTRDRLTRELVFDREGVKLQNVEGTGYPGDPKTKDWLINNADTVFG
jgi:ribonuclease H2 subunit A